MKESVVNDSGRGIPRIIRKDPGACSGSKQMYLSPLPRQSCRVLEDYAPAEGLYISTETRASSSYRKNHIRPAEPGRRWDRAEPKKSFFAREDEILRHENLLQNLSLPFLTKLIYASLCHRPRSPFPLLGLLIKNGSSGSLFLLPASL